MIASALTLRDLRPVQPFHERTKFNGMTFGLGPAGYDLRIREEIFLEPGSFQLASAIEEFRMPTNLLGVVHDKSTWARLGLCVQNTVIEPGWRGFLTIELTNHGKNGLNIKAGSPICQVVFHILDVPTDIPYNGKYQDQPEGIQEAILEPNSQA